MFTQYMREVFCTPGLRLQMLSSPLAGGADVGVGVSVAVGAGVGVGIGVAVAVAATAGSAVGPGESVNSGGVTVCGSIAPACCRMFCTSPGPAVPPPLTARADLNIY